MAPMRNGGDNDVIDHSTTLVLGPVYYLWDADRWRDFYFRIADEAPVDTVIIGETVCSKRLHITEPAFADVVDRLEAAGKSVRLSTLALITLDRESQYQRDLIRDGGHVIEANDLSALNLLKGRNHAVGPLVNVYNGPAARFLAKNGASTICLPPELPGRSVKVITTDCPELAFELFAFGRLPLAVSARCAHARAKGRIKDNCQFVCGEEPDGLTVKTMSNQPFLALNGVQTVSYTCQALLQTDADIKALGVSALRLSPQVCDMVEVAGIFLDLTKDKIDPDEAALRLRTAYPAVPLSNGFHHGHAGAEWVARSRNATMGGPQ
ncbi:ubiquinone anaerobic biosynthesis protein UbiV [Rhizobium sullae]|nr:U32 family peptidase [Rhizobium sullae]